MQKTPNYITEYLHKTLLGRLRLKIFQQITGSEGNFPDSQSVRFFIAEQYRIDAMVGKFLMLLLSIQSTGSVEYFQLKEPANLFEMLCTLDNDPLEEAFFFEIIHCPHTLPDILGALVYCEELKEGGYVYIVNLLDEKMVFPNEIMYAEIRTSQIAPEPAFGILNNGEYLDYSLDNYTDNSFAR